LKFSFFPKKIVFYETQISHVGSPCATNYAVSKLEQHCQRPTSHEGSKKDNSPGKKRPAGAHNTMRSTKHCR
jgi:hypothetical protein